MIFPDDPVAKKLAVLAADSDRRRFERGSARKLRMKKREGRTGVEGDGFWRECRGLQADRCHSVASAPPNYFRLNEKHLPHRSATLKVLVTFWIHFLRNSGFPVSEAFLTAGY